MNLCRLKGEIRIQEPGSSLEPVKILSKIKLLSGSHSSSLDQREMFSEKEKEGTTSHW